MTSTLEPLALLCRRWRRAPPAEPVASHPPEEENSRYGQKTTSDVPNQHQHHTNGDQCDPDQVALPWLRLDEGLSDELTASAALSHVHGNDGSPSWPQVKAVGNEAPSRRRTRCWNPKWAAFERSTRDSNRNAVPKTEQQVQFLEQPDWPPQVMTLGR
jgi:hypothetical protein